ncbi:MAG: hypothetical protein ACJ8AI_29625 [Rhodopila sp.]
MPIAIVTGSGGIVGDGLDVSVSLPEFTQHCAALTGRRLAIGADPTTRPADILWYVSDSRAVSAAGGWSPRRNVPAILSDIYNWLLVHRSSLEPILR